MTTRHGETARHASYNTNHPWKSHLYFCRKNMITIYRLHCSFEVPRCCESKELVIGLGFTSSDSSGKFHIIQTGISQVRPIYHPFHNIAPERPFWFTNPHRSTIVSTSRDPNKPRDPQSDGNSQGQSPG